MNFNEEWKWFPIYIWLIEGGGKRVIVDTACDAEEVMRTSSSRLPYEDISTLEEVLKRFNLTPETVDTVILTHLHADHALNIRKFSNAIIYIQEEELAFARHPHPLFAGVFPTGRIDGITFKIIHGDYHLAMA